MKRLTKKERHEIYKQAYAKNEISKIGLDYCYDFFKSKFSYFYDRKQRHANFPELALFDKDKVKYDDLFIKTRSIALLFCIEMTK